MTPALLTSSPARHATNATSPRSEGREDSANWERTRRAEERLPAIPLADGMFKGRPIIHRDSRIDGGVCVGASDREAIVVDWRHANRPGLTHTLQTLYDTAVERATDDGRFRRKLALKAVFDTVKEHFTDLTPEGVDRLNQRLCAGPDQKVHLQCYIAARTGVCRHVALTCAAILERMVDNGLLFGTVSNDRNTMPGQGGHAWCRYTTSSGTVGILDVMQGFMGTLEESRHQAQWNYARPEERERKNAA